MATEHSAGALTAAPVVAAGPRPAQLRFFHGPMDCGKSTLALQIDHNHARQGRSGLILTQDDRSAQARVTTRAGLSRAAVELSPDTDLALVVRAQWAAGHRVDYLIVDEAQFLTEAQVEQLVDLVDLAGIDVYAFGLSTDFRSRLFPGSRRLLELADVISALQVEVLCWCGARGGFNGRVVGGRLVTEGRQVLIADTEDGAQTRYQVLCRRHYREGHLGPSPVGPEQLPLA